MEVSERLPPCQNRYFVLNYVLYHDHDEETLLFYAHWFLLYKKGPHLNWRPPSPLVVAMPLLIEIYSVIMTKYLTSMHPNIKRGCF